MIGKSAYRNAPLVRTALDLFFDLQERGIRIEVSADAYFEAVWDGTVVIVEETVFGIVEILARVAENNLPVDVQHVVMRLHESEDVGQLIQVERKLLVRPVHQRRTRKLLQANAMETVQNAC